MSVSKRAALPFLAGVLVVTLIVSALAASAFYFEKQRYLERAQVATGNIVNLQVQNVSNLFDKIDVALQSGRLFFSHQNSAQLPAGKIDAYLTHLESVVPEVESIRILNAAGDVIHGSNLPSATPVNLSDRAYFRKAKDSRNAKDGLIVEGPLFARISQKWVIVFARRLSNADGSFAGIIYANLPTAKLEGPLSSAALGTHGAATIRTDTLALVHRVPDTKNSVGSTNVSEELHQAINAQPAGGDYIAATALDGIERSNAYRKIGNYPFYVIVGLATEDYLGSWQQNSLIILVLCLGTILSSALAGYQGYRAHQRMAADLAARTQINQTLQATLAERDKLNDSLAQKIREAEVARLAKNNFLANMSHEMRTPLHQMQGMLHLLHREPLSEKQGQRLHTMQGILQHQTQLVEAVLSLTQIESGHLALKETRLDLAALLSAAVAKYQPEAARKQLALTLHTLPALPELLGDPRQIEQALLNYLSNAIRFTHAGRIDVRLRVAAEDPESLLLRFEVEDTGIGIKPEDQARLFTIFEQVDNSATRQFGGLGAGLAFTRKIAEALHGQAGCESSPDQGSTFWFTVRLNRAL